MKRNVQMAVLLDGAGMLMLLNSIILYLLPMQNTNRFGIILFFAGLIELQLSYFIQKEHVREHKNRSEGLTTWDPDRLTTLIMGISGILCFLVSLTYIAVFGTLSASLLLSGTVGLIGLFLSVLMSMDIL